MMSPIYLDAQSADQTSTDAEADIAETEVNLPEGYLPTLRALNTGGSNAVDVTPYVKFRRRVTSSFRTGSRLLHLLSFRPGKKASSSSRTTLPCAAPSSSR